MLGGIMDCGGSGPWAVPAFWARVGNRIVPTRIVPTLNPPMHGGGLVCTLLLPGDLPEAIGAHCWRFFAYRECMSTQPADPSACHAKLYRDWSHYSGNRLSYAVLVGLAPIPIVLLVAFGLTRRRDRKHSSRQGAPGIRSTQLQPRQTPVTSGSARHPL